MSPAAFGFVRRPCVPAVDPLARHRLVPPGIQARIQAAIALHGGGALQAHDLRTRHAGRSTFIDFHLVVPREMQVVEAHAICDRIEAGLRDELEGAMIAIHVEPEEKAKEVGAIAL